VSLRLAQHQVTSNRHTGHISIKRRSKSACTAFSLLRAQLSQTAPGKFRTAAPSSSLLAQFSSSMQPSIADNKPNILADIKRDHAQFFSLHRQYKESNSDEEKQTLVWQVRGSSRPGYSSWFLYAVVCDL
jgi:hypothetical protein